MSELVVVHFPGVKGEFVDKAVYDALKAECDRYKAELELIAMKQVTDKPTKSEGADD